MSAKYKYFYRVVVLFRNAGSTQIEKVIYAMPPEYRKKGYARYAHICLHAHNTSRRTAHEKRRLLVRVVGVVKIKKEADTKCNGNHGNG